MTKPACVLFALCLALAMAACSSSAPPLPVEQLAQEWAAFMQRDYVLRAGDRLAVRVDDPDADPNKQAERVADAVQEVVVSPTGTIDLRRLPGPLQVAGRSVGALRTLVADAYKAAVFTKAPNVFVSLIEATTQSVYVAGEVRAGGAIPFHPGMTMTMALASAGGFTHLVKHSDVRILRIKPDGTQKTYRVNLESVLLDEWPDFLLLPGDVVWAQPSGIANVGYGVDLYIRRLLPFTIGGPALGTLR